MSPLWQAEDLKSVGGKAYHLSRMMRLGLPVPPGFVVTDAAFQAFLDHNRLREPIAALRQGLCPQDTGRLQSAARTILELIAGATIPLPVREGMGVVIQEMVRSSISGVLFTRAPAPSGCGNDLWAEYCFGHGDVLVSGRINPGRFTISRTDLSWQKRAAPEQPSDPRSEETLFNDARVSLLARMGLDLEREFGLPQDIEWTMDHGGQLYFVQARPITISAPVIDQWRKRSEEATSFSERTKPHALGE